MARASHLHRSERYTAACRRVHVAHPLMIILHVDQRFSIFSFKTRECKMPANPYGIMCGNRCFSHKTLLRAQFAAVRSRLGNIQLCCSSQVHCELLLATSFFCIRIGNRFLALQWQHKKRIVMAPKCDHARYIIYLSIAKSPIFA